MKRKAVFLLIAVVMLTLALPLGATTAQEDVTINVLAMDQAGMTPEEMEEIAARFEAANPGVNIEVSFVLYDGLHDLIVTSVSSNPPAFDVILVDDIWFAEFAEAGWILDVTDRVTDDMRDGVFGAAWGVSRVGDVDYGMPWLLDQKYFFYNSAMLAEAGFDAPPATWEELEEQARVMMDMGLVEYPMIWSWAQIEAVVPDFVSLLYGNGGAFFDENDQPIFNSPEGVATLQWMVDMVNEGIVNPSSITAAEEDVRNVFSQGNAAFATNWLYMYDLANDPEESQIAGDVGITNIPVFESVVADRASATCNGSMGFAVTAGSPNPDMAWAFIEYLTSEPIQIEFSAHQLPIWETAFDTEELIALNPVTVPAFADQFQWAEVRPKVPYYNEASRLLQIAIQEALTGRATPQEALDEAVAAILELAAEYE
ncbi:MAG: extracellular solute-binding protein [Anaerolineae bacterium]|nr:extracellular solute-binding protein [Anaerolineae bacterium]